MGPEARGHQDGEEAGEGCVWRRVGGDLEGPDQGRRQDLPLHGRPRQGEVPPGGGDTEAVRPSQHREVDRRFLGHGARADSDGADAGGVAAGLPEEEGG